MTPADHSLPHRRAVVTHLLASSGVTAIVGQRFYGHRVPDNPAWPFGSYGVPQTQPFEATGWGGSDADITLHAYARGPDEEPCALLAAAIVDALSGDELPLADGLGLVSLDWLNTQIIKDGAGLAESGDYHAIISFRIVTTG